MPPQSSPSRTRQSRAAPYQVRAVPAPKSMPQTDYDDANEDLGPESSEDGIEPAGETSEEDDISESEEESEEQEDEDQGEWEEGDELLALEVKECEEEVRTAKMGDLIQFHPLQPRIRLMAPPVVPTEAPYTLDFGKYKGQGMTLEMLAEEDPSYLDWINSPKFVPTARMRDALNAFNASLRNRRPDYFLVDVIQFEVAPLKSDWQPPDLSDMPNEFRQGCDPDQPLLWISSSDVTKYFLLGNDYKARLPVAEYSPLRYFVYDVWHMLAVHASAEIAIRRYERWEHERLRPWFDMCDVCH